MLKAWRAHQAEVQRRAEAGRVAIENPEYSGLSLYHPFVGVRQVYSSRYAVFSIQVYRVYTPPLGIRAGRDRVEKGLFTCLGHFRDLSGHFAEESAIGI